MSIQLLQCVVNTCLCKDVYPTPAAYSKYAHVQDFNPTLVTSCKYVRMQGCQSNSCSMQLFENMYICRNVNPAHAFFCKQLHKTKYKQKCKKKIFYFIIYSYSRLCFVVYNNQYTSIKKTFPGASPKTFKELQGMIFHRFFLKLFIAFF